MKIKKQHIIIEASQIRSFMEKNKKIPRACSLVDGTILSPYSMSYLLAKLVSDPKQEKVNLVNVIIYHPSKKHDDTITNEDVLKDDYLVMVRNFLSFCEKNHRVPRFITTQKSQTKVSFELFMYCLAKIIVFYQEKGYLPNYCNFNKGFNAVKQTSNKTVQKEVKKSTSNSKKTNNCTNPYKSVPYTTKQGCEELGQNTNYYCSVSALQKCLRKFGIKISQKTLAEVAGVTTKGVGHPGIETAIAYVAKKYNIKLSCKWYNYSELGLEGVAKILCQPNKDVLWHLCYRLEYGHYEKVAEINTKTQILKVMNSLGNKCSSGCFCGYIEDRTNANQRLYCNSISQKSILVITKG